MATINRNRVSRIKDPVVKSLGKLDTAVEVGANAGVTVYDLLTGYDSITLSADAKWDVAGAHKGMTWSPSISYFTPLSRGMVVNLSLSAEHMDDDFADYYFTVSPAQGLASGLPAFSADGGLAAFAIGGYSRMLGDAKRTPPDQHPRRCRPVDDRGRAGVYVLREVLWGEVAPKRLACL